MGDETGFEALGSSGHADVGEGRRFSSVPADRLVKQVDQETLTA